MPDLFYLVSKWWKQLFSIVVLSLVVVAAILFLQPSRYLSTTTALPASSYDADKARIFNENVQLLYPTMGTPDDLDMIVGTAQLDTVYISVAQQFDLAAHYKVREQGEAAVRKAAFVLKANTRVIKSDYSELKVKVWDKDKTMPPQLANAIMQKLQSMHEDLRNESNMEILKGLEGSRKIIQSQLDSIAIFLSRADITASAAQSYTQRRTILSEQLIKSEKLVLEYQMRVSSKPPVLVIAERARISDWPDKPKRLPILIATFVLSLVFGLLVILLIEKSKTIKK